MPHPIPAAVYCRVSGKAQAQIDKHGLSVQIDLCRAYAEREGLSVIEVYSDVVSGAKDDRPALSRLFDDLPSYKAVVLYAQDRLARDVVLAHQYLQRFHDAGLEVHSVTDGRLERGLVFSIKSAVSEDERHKIQRRTLAGRHAEARAGKLPNGTKLYGYRNVSGQNAALPDPLEAPVIVRCYTLAVQGLPYRAIARVLNDEGHRRREGALWSQSLISRLLRNPSYKGQGVWRSHTEGRFTVAFPPLVSPEVWEAAQRKKLGPPVRIPHPLSGHIRCGRCGYAMTLKRVRNRHGTDYEYYRCNSEAMVEESCKNPWIRREEAERQADTLLRDTYTDPEALTRILAPVEDNGATAMRRRAIDARRERIAELREDGIIDRDEARKRFVELQLELNALTAPDAPTLPLERYRRAAQRMPLEELVTLLGLPLYVRDRVLSLYRG